MIRCLASPHTSLINLNYKLVSHLLMNILSSGEGKVFVGRGGGSKFTNSFLFPNVLIVGGYLPTPNLPTRDSKIKNSGFSEQGRRLPPSP